MWVHVEDSVSCAQGDQTLCCTHSEAALMASWNRSQEMCAQQIGAFGTQLVLKAFFFSIWQLGLAKLWPVTAFHQVIQVEVLCAGPCFVLAF